MMTNSSYLSLCFRFVRIFQQSSMCTCNSGWNCCLLSIFGKTDKMLLWSCVCTEKKNLKLEEAVKKRCWWWTETWEKQASLNTRGMAANNTTKANGLKMKFKTTMKNPTKQEGLQLVLVFSNLYLYKSNMKKNCNQ